VIRWAQKKKYDIHYWHGKNATADETGSSAAFTDILSEKLSPSPIHHLEEMGMESDRFMSYFKDGVRYLEGGNESGFKQVTPTVHEPKLLHIKGKRYPRCSYVPLAASSVNDSDFFILDMGDILYVWQGE
jgi:hypothetical protein